jgi:hypothetical protein
VGRGFSPLDEELQLPAGAYSPYLHESIVRLGTWLPFEQVPAGLAWFTEVTCGRETARRLTEAAGTALVAAETAVVEHLEQDWPTPEVPTTRHQLSVDGVMVPLVHQAWAEVKTLAIGAVVPGRGRDGAPTGHAQDLSYFARLTDADTFRRLAWGETHRRGITLAPQVVAVVDGAEWCQGFVDWHCPDAVRILDWAHAAEYVSAAARSVFGAGSAPLVAWLDQHLHELKHGDPAQVLAALRALPAVPVEGPDGPTCPRDEALGYLTRRQEQIAYAAFAAAGWPIGSGAVESANKLLVEARLKGSGMHWARANVDPLLALRCAACSDRWAPAWAQLRAQQRHQATARRTARTAARRAPAPVATPPPETPAPDPRTARRAVARLPLGRMRHGRPTADHKWRQESVRRGGSALPAKD